METRTFIEIENRTRLFVDRVCPQYSTAEDCAINTFGAKKLGNTWQEIFENMHVALSAQPSQVFFFFPFPHRTQLVSVVEEYRKHLHEMGEAETCELHARLFARIVDEASKANEEDVLAVIRKPDNDPLLHILANALGAAGTETTMKVAREQLLVEAPDLLPHFAFGLAHTRNLDDKLVKNLVVSFPSSRNLSTGSSRRRQRRAALRWQQPQPLSSDDDARTETATGDTTGSVSPSPTGHRSWPSSSRS